MKLQKTSILFSTVLLTILSFPFFSIAQSCDSLSGERGTFQQDTSSEFMAKDTVIFSRMREKFKAKIAKGDSMITKCRFFNNHTPATYQAIVGSKEGRVEIITVYDRHGCIEFIFWPSEISKDRVLVRVFNKKITNGEPPPKDVQMRIIGDSSEVTESD